VSKGGGSARADRRPVVRQQLTVGTLGRKPKEGSACRVGVSEPDYSPVLLEGWLVMVQLIRPLRDAVGLAPLLARRRASGELQFSSKLEAD